MAEGRLPDRSLSIVPAGCAPRAVISRQICLTHLYVPSAAIDACAREDGGGSDQITLFDPRFAQDQVLVGLLTGIDDLLDPVRPHSRLLLDQLGNAVTTRLVQAWSSVARATPKATARGGLAPSRLNRVTDYMCENAQRDIGLDELAALSDLSAKHFARAFKQSTGLPPHRWLVARRIDKARELLESGDLDLADIALACGFADQSHFTATFHKATGVTPGAYRREARA